MFLISAAQDWGTPEVEKRECWLQIVSWFLVFHREMENEGSSCNACNACNARFRQKNTEYWAVPSIYYYYITIIIILLSWLLSLTFVPESRYRRFMPALYPQVVQAHRECNRCVMAKIECQLKTFSYLVSLIEKYDGLDLTPFTRIETSLTLV